jgi:hypothetical protein
VFQLGDVLAELVVVGSAEQMGRDGAVVEETFATVSRRDRDG